MERVLMIEWMAMNNDWERVSSILVSHHGCTTFYPMIDAMIVGSMKGGNFYLPIYMISLIYYETWRTLIMEMSPLECIKYYTEDGADYINSLLRGDEGIDNSDGYFTNVMDILDRQFYPSEEEMTLYRGITHTLIEGISLHD